MSVCLNRNGTLQTKTILQHSIINALHVFFFEFGRFKLELSFETTNNEWKVASYLFRGKSRGLEDTLTAGYDKTGFV